ncbi:MAG: hypothetical protein VX178_08950, partial [Pseudomonadota bacterium]|nr:hypothetical protein [Pseudomonadota bacterium]
MPPLDNKNSQKYPPLSQEKRAFGLKAQGELSLLQLAVVCLHAPRAAREMKMDKIIDLDDYRRR